MITTKRILIVLIIILLIILIVQLVREQDNVVPLVVTDTSEMKSVTKTPCQKGITFFSAGGNLIYSVTANSALEHS